MIKKISDEAIKQKNAQVQIWWVANGAGDTLETSNVKLTGAYLPKSSGTSTESSGTTTTISSEETTTEATTVSDTETTTVTEATTVSDTETTTATEATTVADTETAVVTTESDTDVPRIRQLFPLMKPQQLRLLPQPATAAKFRLPVHRSTVTSIWTAR